MMTGQMGRESAVDQDNVLMREALAEARAALQAGVFPVGAVLTQGSRILGRGRKTMDSDHLGHAEINLFRQVFEGRYHFSRSDGLILYTTLEPCIMCWAASRHLPISRLVYAMEDPYGGCAHLQLQNAPPRHRDRPLEIEGGVLREEARKLFAAFLENTAEPFWTGGGAEQFQAAVRHG